MRHSITKLNLFFWVGILTLIGGWIVSSLLVDNPLVIPKFTAVMQAFGKIASDKASYIALLNTVGRIFLTILISLVVALALSVSSYFFNWFKQFIKPLIACLRSTPLAAVIIILLMMFGNDKTPYVVTAFVVIPLLYEGILISLLKIDKGITEEIKMQSKVTPYVMAKVFLPICMPYILSTLLSAIGLGIKVMVMAEFIAQPKNTIGYMMLQEKQALEMGAVFAWTIILLLFVFIVEAIMKVIQNKISQID